MTAKKFFDTSAVKVVIQFIMENNLDIVMVLKSTIPLGFMASFWEKYHYDNTIF